MGRDLGLHEAGLAGLFRGVGLADLFRGAGPADRDLEAGLVGLFRGADLADLSHAGGPADLGLDREGLARALSVDPDPCHLALPVEAPVPQVLCHLWEGDPEGDPCLGRLWEEAHGPVPDQELRGADL